MPEYESQAMGKQPDTERQGIPGALHQAGRVLSFWTRGGTVYLSYKGAQVLLFRDHLVSMYLWQKRPSALVQLATSSTKLHCFKDVCGSTMGRKALI